jgi:PAS domain S-box-containing protein
VRLGNVKSAPAGGWLQGGGEMGARVRALDWSNTPLGPVERWPQSLRSPLSIMLASKAQIILFWGPEYVVLYNDAYRPCFGAKHPTMLGMPGRVAWSEIWDAGANLRALLEGVVRTGEAFSGSDLEFVIERNGFVEETYFDVSYDPVRDESGTVGGVFCIVTETTGRVVGERRLALLKDLAARNATARTPREACTLTIETLAAVPPDVVFALAYLDDELHACTPGARDALTAAPPQQIVEVPFAAGKLVVGLNPRLPFDDRYRSFVGLVADQLSTAVANGRAYEQERKRAEALAELDRAKTAFFSNVSHEFRTPLTLMLGPLEDLLTSADGSLPVNVKRALTLAHNNSLRLLKLVNSLLDFARIESGRVEASYEATDLAAVTVELVSVFRSAAERAGLTLIVDCEPLAEPVFVDRDMWEKIVLNLLSNAFKFTFEGEIEVALRARSDRVELMVRDTGIGIPAADLPKMFQRFQRVRNARARTHEGSGIGLALVRELVKLHGGELGLESQEGRGTTFTVSVPRGKQHLPAERIGAARELAPTRTGAQSFLEEALRSLPDESGRPPAQSAASSAPSLAVGGAARALVLLADDNSDMRDYVRRLLERQYDVVAASDGQQALDSIAEHVPDLVLTDVMMPRLDGFGLLAAVRADPRTRSLPVIMLSARAGEEARIEGAEAGADDYLVKPFSARELLARVGSHLALARQRGELERALRYRSEQLETLLDSAPLGIYLIGPDFRIRSVNPVARPTFGDIPGGVEGRDFEEVTRLLWERSHADEIVGIFRHTFTTGESYFTREHPVIRPGRSVPEYYEWRLERITLPDGERGLVCYFRDVTAHVAARTAVEESRQALREADRRKDEFLATLAHELRTPLAPIHNALQILRLAGHDAAVARSVHDMMDRQVNHMVRLVDDLMEVSRITRGKIDLRRQNVDLSTVVGSAVETTRPLLDVAGHTLTVDLGGEPFALDADPVRLAQVFSNLLNNAAKYTPCGGQIAVRAERRGSNVIVSVRDNGAGMRPEVLAHVFDPFVQGERSYSRSQGGLGIGLTLARSIVVLHGGSIEARSRGLGQGSELIVQLPLAQAVAADAAVAPARPAMRVAGQRILVVDDNVDAAESLSALLRSLGAEVTTVYDGPAALEAMRTAKPAAAVLDIGMPGMDGYEVARRARAAPEGEDITLIALTGWGNDEDRRRSREAGIDHHLVKPVDLQVLEDLLAARRAVPRDDLHREPQRSA